MSKNCSQLVCFRLGKAEGIDELIEKAKHINFDAYNHINLRGYHRTMREMVEYFTKEYNKKAERI